MGRYKIIIKTVSGSFSNFQNNNIFFNFQKGVLLRINIFFFFLSIKTIKNSVFLALLFFLYTKFIPNTFYSKYFRR